MAGLAMHPLYDASRVELAEDDVQGACALYPRSGGPAFPSLLDPPRRGGCPEDGCAQGYECIDDQCGESTDSLGGEWTYADRTAGSACVRAWKLARGHQVCGMLDSLRRSAS
jgi:hypothetical protein